MTSAFFDERPPPPVLAGGDNGRTGTGDSVRCNTGGGPERRAGISGAVRRAGESGGGNEPGLLAVGGGIRDAGLGTAGGNGCGRSCDIFNSMTNEVNTRDMGER